LEHSQRYQLGNWIVCPQTNTITNLAGTQAIDNKSMQVLLYLIQHSGEDLTKSQIFEHVWKTSVVTDDILSVSVSKIRKALGDNARSPTFIKTLPGVGYVLIADVKKLDSTEQATVKSSKSSKIFIGAICLLIVAVLVLYLFKSGAGSSSQQLNINSIAVLPFDDLSAKQDNQHFSDGLSDAIINQLSQIKQLKVISRYSSFTYRGNYNASEIGDALQVDTLLDGSVQKMGEQVRINVRIFNTTDGQQLWSRTFDSDIQNNFRLQDNISSAIQEIIQPDYVSRDSSPNSKPTKTINAQAYEWYLLGQYHWRQRNPTSLSKAETYFKHSLELEPDYADAHVGLAITYANLHNFANWSEKKATDKALPHIERALSLKPNSPTALAAKGMILNLTTQVQQAEDAFLRSLELDDNATTHRWYSKLLRRLGKESLVIQHMNKAIALNPLSGSLKRSYSSYLGSQGKQDSAQRMYQSALILEPDHFSHVIDSSHMFRHTQESIIVMAEWQVANAELFTSCSSDEYCEQVALAYLSIGATDAANNILTNMGSRHRHFRNSLDLINLGINEEEEQILSIKERLALRLPNKRGVIFELAVAQFRTDKFESAKNTLLELYPQWRNTASIGLNDITADNYIAMVLYAVTLSSLQEKEVAHTLLQEIQTFLKQDKVFDKIQAQFTLAEVNAQLENTTQALLHLSKALDMGWLETYDSEWWSLENNHLLRPLNEEPEFKLLLNQHQENLSELREKVNRKLNTTPRSIE